MKQILKKITIERLKKEKSFLVKICIFFIISTLLYSAFNIYSYYYDLNKIILENDEKTLRLQEQIVNKKAKKKVKKEANNKNKETHEIFDLSQGQDNEDIQGNNINEFEIDDLEKNESNPKIIDALIRKIEELSSKLVLLERKLENYSKKDNKILVSYVKLRQKIFLPSDNDYYLYEELKDFEFLATDNEFLLPRIKNLKNIIKNKVSHKKLINKFEVIERKLISNKEFSNNSKVLNKLYEFLSRYIVIKKIKNANTNSVDEKIILIKASLSKKDYKKVRDLIESVDYSKDKLISDFIFDIKDIILVKNIDQEILNYFLNNEIKVKND